MYLDFQGQRPAGSPHNEERKCGRRHWGGGGERDRGDVGLDRERGQGDKEKTEREGEMGAGG